ARGLVEDRSRGTRTVQVDSEHIRQPEITTRLSVFVVQTGHPCDENRTAVADVLPGLFTFRVRHHADVRINEDAQVRSVPRHVFDVYRIERSTRIEQCAEHASIRHLYGRIGSASDTTVSQSVARPCASAA